MSFVDSLPVGQAVDLIERCVAPTDLELPFRVELVIVVPEEEGQSILVAEDGRFILCHNPYYKSISLTVLEREGLLTEAQADAIREKRESEQELIREKERLGAIVTKAYHALCDVKSTAEKLPQGVMDEAIEKLEKNLAEAQKMYRDETGEEWFFDPAF